MEECLILVPDLRCGPREWREGFITDYMAIDLGVILLVALIIKEIKERKR